MAKWLYVCHVYWKGISGLSMRAIKTHSLRRCKCILKIIIEADIIVDGPYGALQWQWGAAWNLINSKPKTVITDGNRSVGMGITPIKNNLEELFSLQVNSRTKFLLHYKLTNSLMACRSTRVQEWLAGALYCSPSPTALHARHWSHSTICLFVYPTHFW